MSVPFGQMWAVVRHVVRQRLLGNSKYPLVLMLEPLFRCNLACGGCGKIQHPVDVLRPDRPLGERAAQHVAEQRERFDPETAGRHLIGAGDHDFLGQESSLDLIGTRRWPVTRSLMPQWATREPQPCVEFPIQSIMPRRAT